MLTRDDINLVTKAVRDARMTSKPDQGELAGITAVAQSIARYLSRTHQEFDPVQFLTEALDLPVEQARDLADFTVL
jgi:hypothetical protein